MCPIMLVLTIILFVEIKGNPIFSQVRIGKDDRSFKILKFKTMSDDRDDDGNLLSDELRLSKFGSLLRKLSLDELPQLFNVLKGDMSFVGPRPLLPEYLPLYNAEQLRRHEVVPGITGWAQVNGRNGITWERKFELDIWYIDNYSLILDFKILVLTVKKVFQRDNIQPNKGVTMDKFRG